MTLLAVLATAEARPLGSTSRTRRKPKLHGRYRIWAVELVGHLVERRTARGWRYNVKNRVESLQIGGPEDIVSTHLVGLALLSAHRLGIKTERSVWDDLLGFTLDQQEGSTLYRPDPRKPRGFAYIQGHPVADEGLPTGGATACGIALVRMALHVLTNGDGRPELLKERLPRIYEQVRTSIDPAYLWLAEHWSAYANPGKRKGQKVQHHHWLWAFETAQDLVPAPEAKLGEHAWYAEIAKELINRQHEDGRWHVQGSWEPADVLDTCFAVLFLKRATRGLIAAR